MNTRNASNVDYEMAQWHKLYKSIEENVRREILMDVNDKMNKLKRKNRKLKDQNKCLMEMMSMMRTPLASRFVPHTPSGVCTPVPEPVLVASKEPVLVASKESALVAYKEPVEVKVIHVKVEKVSTKNNITIDLCDNVQNEIVLKKELVAPPVVVIDEPEEEEQEEEEEVDEQEEEEEQEEELEQEEVEVDEQEEEQEELDQEVEELEELEELEEVEEQEEEEVEEQEELEEVEEPKQVITAEVAKVVEPEEEEEEESVEEVFINNKRYYTTNLLNGVIYDIDEEDNPGNEVGKIVDGKPILKAVPASVPVAVPEEEEEEESVEEWEFEDDKYYVSNTKDGKIYLMTKDEEVGDEIGKFVNGKPIFYD